MLIPAYIGGMLVLVPLSYARTLYSVPMPCRLSLSGLVGPEYRVLYVFCTTASWAGKFQRFAPLLPSNMARQRLTRASQWLISDPAAPCPARRQGICSERATPLYSTSPQGTSRPQSCCLAPSTSFLVVRSPCRCSKYSKHLPLTWPASLPPQAPKHTTHLARDPITIGSRCHHFSQWRTSWLIPNPSDSGWGGVSMQYTKWAALYSAVPCRAMWT